MSILARFRFVADGAAKPVLFGVPSYVRIRVPLPTGGKSMLAVVLSAAGGAGSQGDAGGAAVAAAIGCIDSIAALPQAGTGVGFVVAAGLPLAPVVAQNTVLSAALLAGFARGAGGRFSAAGMKSERIIRNPLLNTFAGRAFSLYPVRYRIRRRTDRGRKVSNQFELSKFFAVDALVLQQYLRFRCGLPSRSRQKAQHQRHNQQQCPVPLHLQSPP